MNKPCGSARASRSGVTVEFTAPISQLEYAKRFYACAQCKRNVGGVCKVLAADGRQARIDSGIKLPQASCPLRYWGPTQTQCPSCHASIADPNGFDVCPAGCGFQFTSYTQSEVRYVGNAQDCPNCGRSADELSLIHISEPTRPY